MAASGNDGSSNFKLFILKEGLISVVISSLFLETLSSTYSTPELDSLLLSNLLATCVIIILSLDFKIVNPPSGS